jgi:hypothetical protein
MPMRADRIRALAPRLMLYLGVAYLVLTRLVLAWNGIIGADGARDLAVASRLLRGEAFPLRGPLFGESFYLGPIHYFVVALPLALFGSATAVIAALALLSLAGVYFAHRVGTLLFDRRTGLLFACLLGGDFVAALAAFQLSNVPLILPISLALLHTTLLAIVHRRPQYLGIALPLAAVALQVHPATVALLPLLAVALCLPTERGKAKALAIGTTIALILFAPFLLHEFLHHWDNLRRIIGLLERLPRPGEGQALSNLPRIFWWVAFLSPRAAMQLSEGMTPMWLRHTALVALHAVSLAALAGLGLAIAGLFRREQRRSCALVLCWFLPWWLIAPGALEPITWWHLYPIQPALLLFAALGVARLSDRLPLSGRWRVIAPYAFGLFAFVLPAWLAMAAFQRSSAEGFLRLPGSLVWRPDPKAKDADDFAYPSIGVRQEERLTKALLQESGCSASLLTRLHGLPLWLTLQSRGILLQLHQPRCKAGTDSGHALSFIGVRPSDLPPEFRDAAEDVRGPLLLARQVLPGPLAEARYGVKQQSGWETYGLNDSAWRRLTLPALRPPDPTAYPPPPDMSWDRSPIFIRARLRYSGAGPVLLGVAFPSSAPWLYQGRVEAVFVNGRPAPPPRLRASYLLLYDLGSLLTPGENLLALAIGGAPHFTLDLFTLTGRRLGVPGTWRPSRPSSIQGAAGIAEVSSRIPVSGIKRGEEEDAGGTKPQR